MSDHPLTDTTIGNLWDQSREDENGNSWVSVRKANIFTGWLTRFARAAYDQGRADADELLDSAWWPFRCAPSDCPKAPHRGPEGPNEDMGQCGRCGSPSWSMRPWGETFGYHLDDCSLPIWHESRCQPGGTGHPMAPTIRG